MSPIGTWWDRQEPSVFWPSTSFGPVHPFGERKTIIGQRGRAVCPLSRAASWIPWIFATASSSAAAISWCMAIGSSPSTKIGS